MLHRISTVLIMLCAAGLAHAAGVDKFTSPNGGEVYLIGQKQQVHIAMGSFKADVLIEISTDGGKTFSALGTVAAPSKTLKEFVLDYTVSGPASANTILRASSTSAKTPTTIFSQVFTITASDISGGVQVQPGGVDSTQLADGSVTTNKLATSAVTTPKLADGGVTAVKIAAKTITPDKLSSQSASSGFVLTSDGVGGALYQPVPSATFVATGAVNNASVAEGAGISYSKLNLSGSIVSSDIKDGSILDADISSSAGIQYSKLNLTNSIAGSDIKDGSISDIDINANAGIQYSKLNLTNSIVSGDIKDGSIIDADINANAGIQYSKLSLINSIVSADIKAGAIVDANIAANAAIKYSKLNLFGSVSTSDIVAGAIIDSSVSNFAAISYSKLNLQNSIVNGDLKDGEITNAKIAANAAIPYSKLNLSSSIVGSDFAPGGITLDKISTATAASGQVLTYDGANLVFSSNAAGFSVPVTKNAQSASNLLDLTNSGDGSAGSFSISSTTSVAAALIGKTAASGDGVFGQSFSGVAVHGRKASGETGSAGLFENNNSSNTSDTLGALTNGTGPALRATNNGTGSAAIIESNNSGNASTALKVTQAGTSTGLSVDVTSATSAASGVLINHAGTGSALEIKKTNPADSATGISLTHMGIGDGITSTSTGGIGIVGIANVGVANNNLISGVEGDNNGDGPGVTAFSNTVNFGALTAINGSSGAAVFAYTLGNGGTSVFGFGGAQGTNSTAAHFENINTTNTANVVDIKSSGPSPHLAVVSTSSTPAQGVTIAMPATATSAGSTALKVTNGAVALGATNNYATGAAIDNAYQIVTVAGDIALPTAAPLQDGATTWVINNTAVPINVTNTTGGSVAIAPGNAKQFLFVKAVSTINWIPVQQ